MTLSDALNNLALGKTVTIQRGGTLFGYIAQHITDGHSSTMWRSYAADMPATLTAETTLDLGETMLFNQIVLTEYKQYAVRLIVSISDDGDVWIPVYDRVPAFTERSNRKTMIEVDHLAARYIRVTAPDAIYGFGICELEVYHQTGFSSMIVCTDLHGGEAREVRYPRDQFHLYLLIGQSNMASRAPLEDRGIPAPDRVYLFNGLNQWEDAAAGLVANYPDKTELQGLNRYSSVELKNKSNGLSLGTVAARELTDALPHIAVGLISNARGGTSLAQWQKGCGTWLYEEAVRRTKEAMKSGTLKGILWHQGESDVGHADSYLSDLNAIVVNLRADLDIPDVPFIAGQIMPGKSDTFNAMLESIGQTIAHADWVSSCGTASIGDGSHFDAASQRLLGRRYAGKLWPMVYADMAVTELPEE
ncbi:sialate O-acetylesterase [Paenibacillus chungangensis]|uniref:Sialate O-acetylesterase n=1 Tax=Paenibacillus chungangensis TaxID=696535 RepID=A0ABW3HS00_9BACL